MKIYVKFEVPTSCQTRTGFSRCPLAGSASAQATEESKKGKQGTHQPADEEIGDYADPDAIQVDGGDNSFIADQPEEAAGAKKKSDAK